MCIELINRLEDKFGSLEPGDNTLDGIETYLEDSDGTYIEATCFTKPDAGRLIKKIKASGFIVIKHNDRKFRIE